MGQVRPFLDKKRQALAASHRELPRTRAEVIAFRANTSDLVDDMESAGDEGLCWAAHRYTMSEGIPFRPFAQMLVDRTIFHFLRRELRHRQLRVAGYILSSWAASQVPARSVDLIDVMHDDDEKCIAKLHQYVAPKVMAGALALCVDAEQSGEDPEQVALAGAAIAAVRKELSECDTTDQYLFSAVYGEGKTLDEVSADLGLNRNTVKSRHLRLVRALREVIAPHLGPLEGEKPC